MLAQTLVLSALAFSRAAPLNEPILRVYDTRDLAAALPASPGSVAGGFYHLVPRLESSGPDGALVRLDFAPASGTAKAAESAAPADLVVSRLCDQLSLQREPLVEGVYLITGEAEQHEQFVKLLEDVRSLYQGAYELEIFAYPASAAQAPALGASAESTGVTLRSRQVIGRRVESHIAMTEEISYVRDWQPVVGNSSVGYDPEPGTATKGLRLAVTAGAVERAGGSSAPGGGRARPAPDSASSEAVVTLRVRGEYMDVQIEKQSSPLGPLSGGALELGLPHTITRTIESDMRLPLGQPSVLAVVAGAKPGEVLVIAGAIRELK